MQVMQSNKWTFSLASLVMFLAIGLIFAPTVMAHETKPKNAAGAEVAGNPHHPTVELSVPSAYPRGITAATAGSSVDVSTMDGIQMLEIAAGSFWVQAKWSVFVTLDGTAAAADANSFDPADILLEGFDANGFPVTIPDTPAIVIRNAVDTNRDGTADATEMTADGINYQIGIPNDRVPDTVATLYVSVKDASLINPDPTIHPLHKAHPTSVVSAKLKIELVDDPDDSNTTGVDEDVPLVNSVTRVPNVTTPVSGAFTVEVKLSEMPASTVDASFFTIMNGTIDRVDPGTPMDEIEAAEAVTEDNSMATGYDDKVYPYYLTITPKFDLAKDTVHMVKLKVNNFEDTNQPVANEYAAGLDYNYEIQIALASLTGPAPGFSHPDDVAVQKALPAVTVKAGGYLVLLNKDAEAGHAGITKPAATDNYIVQEKFNWWEGINAHASDLESFFRNGGTIQVIAGKDLTGTLIVTEIMWGSHNGAVNNQWIELHNPGTADLMIAANTWFLGIYGPAGRSAADLAADVNFKVVDEMSNSPGGAYWSILEKGSSARAHNIPGDPNEPAISTYRVIINGVAQDGTMASSWMQSALPNANVSKPDRIGTPGAASPPGMAPAPPVVVPPPPPTPPTPTPVAMKDDIAITEIMADSGNGRFPQWIEITNTSGKEVSLDGWMLNISNDPADADVVGSSLVIDLGGNTLGVSEHAGNMGKGQSLLIIAFSGRGSDNLGNVSIIDASGADQLDQTGRYLLLSETAFKLVLMPPQMTGITVYGNMAGNLDAGAATWPLPMAEGMRSSLIRREMDAMDMETMGTEEKGWRLASMTDLASGQITWYGSDEDAGTPGYDAGGPLPVELSMFYPTRDRLSGAVVITWETQSELNNAGFFIKRSEAKNGEFKVVNPTMIQGAGTTSEKQSYTYTDTSAKPNVVYYYQIEDVSLDGQRQNLTIGTRLRGHVGAAGKLTATWGELKSQE